MSAIQPHKQSQRAQAVRALSCLLGFSQFCEKDAASLPNVANAMRRRREKSPFVLVYVLLLQTVFVLSVFLF